MNEMNKTIRTLTCAILGLAATAKIQAETVTSVTLDANGYLRPLERFIITIR